MPEALDTRCAVIALAGKPNSGKSTLLNAIVGAKLAITSPKPQSTRQPVVGIHTEGATQLVFVDPPGLLDEPRYLLQQAMMEQVTDALRGADAILYLSTLADGPPPPLEQLVPADALKRQPVATVLTGADLVPQRERPAVEPPTFLVGSPTMNNQIYPSVAELMVYMKGLRPRNLVGAAFGSYGWNGQAVAKLDEALLEMGVELAEEGLRVCYVPDQQALADCRAFGTRVGAKLNAALA